MLRLPCTRKWAFKMVIAKAYKIQDARGKKRTGVVASSLADLKQKGASKLAVSKNCRVCLEDGTDVEDNDYFKSLPPQTVLVFERPDETWEGRKFLKHRNQISGMELQLALRFQAIPLPGVNVNI